MRYEPSRYLEGFVISTVETEGDIATLTLAYPNAAYVRPYRIGDRVFELSSVVELRGKSKYAGQACPCGIASERCEYHAR